MTLVDEEHRRLNTTTEQLASVMYPLTAFEQGESSLIEHAEVLDARLLPQPYRSLLVHLDDMTPTLEAFYDCTLTLKVLARQLDADTLFRQVLLADEQDEERVVEFGAIRIELARFDEEPRRLIEQCRVPLGTILGRYAVAHDSRPDTFFQIEPGKALCELFRMDRPQPVYGRHNKLRNMRQETLAEIVEILPPAELLRKEPTP